LYVVIIKYTILQLYSQYLWNEKDIKGCGGPAELCNSTDA
jgi:hypothetical protein